LDRGIPKLLVLFNFTARSSSAVRNFTAGWNKELLHLELGDLKLADFDLSLIGFDADALDVLLTDPDAGSEGLTDDDAVPETQERVISQPGDVWVLGEHTLLCGDATQDESYDRLLGAETVQLIWSDLPYNVNYANSAKGKPRGKPSASVHRCPMHRAEPGKHVLAEVEAFDVSKPFALEYPPAGGVTFRPPQLVTELIEVEVLLVGEADAVRP
jgi:hypothetical protein